ncbi:cytochrome P450 [Infundibulicybe gibba]|nr:cytochrome P450 [Infundibulicybe gibba]
MISSLFFCCCFLALCGCSIIYRRVNRNRLPYPPGPKGFPLIGSLLDIPREGQWNVYNKWAQTYGDIVHFKVLGQPFIVLNSLKRTTDIFHKRSSLYSSRPGMPMLVELMNWDIILSFLPYGPAWRARRRLFHENFHVGAVGKYKPIQARESRKFLRRLLETPDDFMHHVRHGFSGAIMDIVYGIKVEDSNDRYITVAEEALSGMAQAGVAGSFLVDFMPGLQYIPTWMPGAGFRKKAADWRKLNNELTDKPWAAVKIAISRGEASPSLAATLMENLPHGEGREAEEEVAKSVSAVAFAGGADTTVSSVQTFFLAMAIHVDIQKKAQAELDAVVGTDRLPEFSDHGKMFLPSVPLSHASVADDEYDGYFIPKGTIIIGNAWSIMHDPEAFTDPDEFRPERYLNESETALNPDTRDLQVATFGFGRRICPGRHLSDNSLYSYISSILAVFSITPPLDANGKYTQLEVNMTSGMFRCVSSASLLSQLPKPIPRYPEPFKCDIKPRSKTAEKLILESQDFMSV